MSSKGVFRGKYLTYNDDTIHVLQRASNALDWRFTVPGDGKTAKRTFRFDFPETLDTNRLVFFTIEMSFEGKDQSFGGEHRSKQVLSADIRSANPCLTLKGAPDGSFMTRVGPF